MSNDASMPRGTKSSRVQQRTGELEALIDLFYSDRASLAAFEFCERAELPSEYALLLAHSSHMTVTVEKRHGCSVSVEVLRSKLDSEHYCREILLRRVGDNRVVQYGIVRLRKKSLAEDVLAEILAEKTPLGRVLINHSVLTQVGLLGLWRVRCAQRLASLLNVTVGQLTYGRTALIYCDGTAAIELLEIVAPEEGFDAMPEATGDE